MSPSLGQLLPLAALLEVTGGRAITGLRYRRLGERSSEWRSCPREGDMLHPPPGGWSQAADYVVFADRRGVLEGNKSGEGPDCQVGQRRRCEVEMLQQTQRDVVSARDMAEEYHAKWQKVQQEAESLREEKQRLLREAAQLRSSQGLASETFEEATTVASPSTLPALPPKLLKKPQLSP